MKDNRDELNKMSAKPYFNEDESIFGYKPDNCIAKFEHCGQCNIYPCLIEKPNLNLKK